jgi:hypothetical protein
MLLLLDFAYRQTITLCPEDVETVKHYVNLLRDKQLVENAR